MNERHTINQSLYVRASMFTAEELRRQKRIGLSDINEGMLDGLIKQKIQLDTQIHTMVRTLLISLFLAFVAWNGGDIKIPGTGATIGEVPAFLELSIIAASFCVLVISYTFLSIQMYSAVISTIAQELLAKNDLDTDLFVASKEPIWLFAKYARAEPVIGRSPGFKISKAGYVYNGVLVISISLVLVSSWIFSIFTIFYIAHTGLANSIFDWFVYLFCIAIIIVAIITMAANFLQFEHELDFEKLESNSTE